MGLFRDDVLHKLQLLLLTCVSDREGQNPKDCILKKIVKIYKLSLNLAFMVLSILLANIWAPTLWHVIINNFWRAESYHNQLL